MNNIMVIRTASLWINYMFLAILGIWLFIKFGSSMDRIEDMVAQFFFTIAMFTWPLIVNLVYIHFSKSSKTQKVLLILSLLYILWSLYVVVATFVTGKPDALSGMVFLFAPIYSLPIMIIGWSICLSEGEFTDKMVAWLTRR